MNLTDDNIRVDKWLWATRVFKTRSLAANACKNSQISVNGIIVKPSRTLQIGDIITVKKAPIMHTYKVLGFLSQRQSAKVAAEYIEDQTPLSEIEQLKISRLQKSAFREPGLGRPTKKERRSLEDFGYL